DRVRSVVERSFLGADDVRLRVGQDGDTGFLAPGAAAEAILAAGLAARVHRELHMAAVQDVDREVARKADRGMERDRTIDADDHRWRLHAQRVEGGRGRGVPRPAAAAGDDGDRAGEPAQREPGLRGELIIRGEGRHCGLSLLLSLGAAVQDAFSFDTVPYCTLQCTVRY